MSLLEKLTKNKKLKEYVEKTDILNSTKVEFINTGCVPLNILYSGRINGGIPKYKISVIAGESKTSKSMQSLILAKNAIKKGMEVIYIDTENAITDEILENYKIDKERMLLINENIIGNIKEALMNITSDLSVDERKNLLVIIDSWGMLVSEKSIDNAVSGKDVADLHTTREKNSLALMLIHLLPATVFVVAHTYSNISGNPYTPDSISGGSKLIYSASSIVQITSTAKSKDSENQVNGKVVTAKAFKSRFCKEETKYKFLIKYSGGLHPVYGLLEDALECGAVFKPNMGWYQRSEDIVQDDKKWREKEIWDNWKEFWYPILKSEKFRNFIESKYTYKVSKFDVDDFDIEERKSDDEMGDFEEK